MPPVPILPGHDRGAPTTLTPHLLGNICWDFPLLHILHGLGKAHPAACPEMLRVQQAVVFLFPSSCSELLQDLLSTCCPAATPCCCPRGDPVPNISGFP